MTDYKLVPVEPTREMVEAAEDAHMPFGDMDLAIRMALLAAPAVQGEPVAVADALRQIAGWMDDGGPTYCEAEMIGMEISGPTECSSHRRCAEAGKRAFLEAARIWERMHPRQPAEQQPAPDVSALVAALGRALDFIRGDGDFEHREALERCECYACVTGEIIDSLASPAAEPEFSPDRKMLLLLLEQFDNDVTICENCGHEESISNCYSAHMLRAYLNQPAPTPAPSLSPEVLAFAHLMQAKLDQNTHKDGNGKRGWKGCTLPWLFARLLDEVQELQDAIQSGQEIEREAADVGNMAMMIAEVASGSATNQINREAADD